MINYTERIALLMQDVVVRTPRLSFIDLREVLVFGRFGRSDAEGAFATCHCLTLPESEPGYYFWRDRSTGELTRRSEWFVTKSPEVRIGGTRVKYLDLVRAAALLRPDARAIAQGGSLSADAPGWLAKLDTIVHELYHIDPDESGIRRVARADGTDSPRSHGPHFYEDVAEMVHGYLAPAPIPRSTISSSTISPSSPRATAASSRRRSGIFPSFPQRYMEAVDMAAAEPIVKVEPLKPLDAARSSTPRTICTSASSPRPARGASRGRDSTGPHSSAFSSLRHAPRADKPRRPVTRAEPLDTDLAVRARRVHEFIPTNRDPHVRCALTQRAVDRVEEDEVASAKISSVHITAGAELLGHGSRDADAVLIEDVPDEAAAIEAGRIVSAILVRRAPEQQRGSGNRVPV